MSDELKVDDYVVSFVNAKKALRLAAEKADKLGSPESGLGVQQQVDALALASDLGAQLVLLVDAHNRFMAQFFLPNPPTSAVVNEAIEKLKLLAREVADSILAEGKLEVVIGVVDALNQFAKPATATAAPSPAAAGVGGPQGVAAAPVAAAPTGPQLAMAATTTHWLRQMRRRQ